MKLEINILVMLFLIQNIQLFLKKINQYNEHKEKISYIAIDIENIFIDEFLKDNFKYIKRIKRILRKI